MDMGFLRDLAILLLTAKFFGLVARKIGAPQVVGEIFAGLLLGPAVLNMIQMTDEIAVFAEIGVILMMFSTGLGTNLKDLLRTGPVAAAMAMVGVFVPLVCGTLLYSVFYGFGAVGSQKFFEAVFIGTIMTATSVSITVATLQELGKLKTELGTVIVSAAVIDDVIGILVLTCVISTSGGGGSIGQTLLRTVIFFAVAVIGGFVVNHVVEMLDQHAPHTQRLPILGIGFCLLMAYISEEFFGIADITGAYVAGIILCTIDDAKYIERRVDISSYLFFAPVFLAGVGLKTSLDGVTPSLILFCICFVLVAMVTKIIGCGAVAKLVGYNWNDSLKAGIGMMTRGEVALIVAQKGLAAGLVEEKFFTAVILLILISSFLTPFALKKLYGSDHSDGRRNVMPRKKLVHKPA